MLRGNSITFMVLIVLVLTLFGQSVAQERDKNEDLVIIEYDRRVNTINGEVKNFHPTPARDLTVVVTFRDSSGFVLGHQTARLGDLLSGESTSFKIRIEDKFTEAARFNLRPIAIWSP